jgi:hypothetical protein
MEQNREGICLQRKEKRITGGKRRNSWIWLGSTMENREEEELLWLGFRDGSESLWLSSIDVFNPRHWIFSCHVSFISEENPINGQLHKWSRSGLRKKGKKI